MLVWRCGHLICANCASKRGISNNQPESECPVCKTFGPTAPTYALAFLGDSTLTVKYQTITRDMERIHRFNLSQVRSQLLVCPNTLYRKPLQVRHWRNQFLNLKEHASKKLLQLNQQLQASQAETERLRALQSSYHAPRQPVHDDTMSIHSDRGLPRSSLPRPVHTDDIRSTTSDAGPSCVIITASFPRHVTIQPPQCL